ncbi:hypothetical protein BU17DRAFT_102961 [Hysterangium stoloniferum]|nr:hypothetical protein BU17DRAFT_102961 [Hysterangium stoloniferum]
MPKDYRDYFGDVFLSLPNKDHVPCPQTPKQSVPSTFEGLFTPPPCMPLERIQPVVSDFSTRFVEIDIIADFERTSWGLARLGEWEGGTTSFAMEPIDNATSVRKVTTTVTGGCTKAVEEIGHPERAMNVDGKEVKSKSKTPSFISGPTSTYLEWMQPPFNLNNPKLTQPLEANIQSTFEHIPNMVQRFGGFSQMLEITHMLHVHRSSLWSVWQSSLGSCRMHWVAYWGCFGDCVGSLAGRPVYDGGMSDEFNPYLARLPGNPLQSLTPRVRPKSASHLPPRHDRHSLLHVPSH